jgi:hypothetical protein
VETEQVTLNLHETRIVYAYRQLLAARKAWDHSPNPDTQLWMQQAEQYLNDMLDQRPRDAV